MIKMLAMKITILRLHSIVELVTRSNRLVLIPWQRIRISMSMVVVQLVQLKALGEFIHQVDHRLEFVVNVFHIYIKINYILFLHLLFWNSVLSLLP
jgi:hypothetical protein